jgi:formate hydrogenlyase transcriptional activator
MKIAIIEDQFIEAFDLQLMLQHNGYTVSGIAHSVSDGMALIKESSPRLVCIDIMLKGKDNGIDLAEKLALLGIGFIYISASSNSSVADRALLTNPYGFIAKPFREQDVLPVIENAFAQMHRNGKASR